MLRFTGALIAARLAYVASRGHYLRYGGFGAPDLMALTGGWREMRPVVGSLVGIAGCLLLVAAVLVPRLRMPVLGVIVATCPSGTTAGARSWAQLPAQAIKYVRRIEELIRCPVALVSTSPERDDTILVRDPFAG